MQEQEQAEKTADEWSGKDEDLMWLFGRWAFTRSPDGKCNLWVEWSGFFGDEDNPRKTVLKVEDATNG